MYRDDPLDDEMELRAIIGDEAVDRIVDAGVGDPLAIALDVLRLLQGWVSDDEAASWFASQQKRLDDRTPVTALEDGDGDEVLDAARHWSAARG